MLVGVFEVRETPARTMSASSQFSGADAVVMGDGELDRVDAGEIGGVERVLAAGPALGLLAAAPPRARRSPDRAPRRRGCRAAGTCARARGGSSRLTTRVEDQARPPLDIVEHPVEMAFGADHRPEMLDRLDIVELGEAGLGDHVQRLAGRSPRGGAGGAASMPGPPEIRLWKTMGKSLAEGSGQTQGQDSSPIPRNRSTARANTGKNPPPVCG